MTNSLRFLMKLVEFCNEQLGCVDDTENGYEDAFYNLARLLFQIDVPDEWLSARLDLDTENHAIEVDMKNGDRWLIITALPSMIEVLGLIGDEPQNVPQNIPDAMTWLRG